MAFTYALATLFAVIQIQSGQTSPCQNLDTSLQRKWTNGVLDITFSNTKIEVSTGMIGARISDCVVESDGFRLYREDFSLFGGDYTRYECIKVLESSQSGYLELARYDTVTVPRTAADDDLCSVCRVKVETRSPVLSLVEHGSGLPPLQPIEMTCNLPEICPGTEAFDKPCSVSGESDLDAFCSSLLAILDGQASEEIDDSDDLGDEPNHDFRQTEVKRRMWQKKSQDGEQKRTGSGMRDAVSSNDNNGDVNKNKINCNKKLRDEIIATCSAEVVRKIRNKLQSPLDKAQKKREKLLSVIRSLRRKTPLL